ncbi:hypothetical protein DL770_010356 [Monosporascus sp. CRB-9-2]|nr:hypothetical protein DL770_010356 [Monosporascus sp. CRB-9-2]
MDTSKEINKTDDLEETKESPTFPQFGHLPRELRHIIWKEAVKSTQYVEADPRYFVMSEYDTLVVKGMYAELCHTEFGGSETSRIRNVMVSANLFYDYHIKEFCKRGLQFIRPLWNSELYRLQGFGWDLAIAARKLVGKLGNLEALESVTAAIHP